LKCLFFRVFGNFLLKKPNFLRRRLLAYGLKSFSVAGSRPYDGGIKPPLRVHRPEAHAELRSVLSASGYGDFLNFLQPIKI
jgi:hypothetical protein